MVAMPMLTEFMAAYEIGLGANLGIAKNSNLYFDALKTFNGNLRTEWQFNAGLRFSF